MPADLFFWRWVGDPSPTGFRFARGMAVLTGWEFGVTRKMDLAGARYSASVWIGKRLIFDSTRVRNSCSQKFRSTPRHCSQIPKKQWCRNDVSQLVRARGAPAPRRC